MSAVVRSPETAENGAVFLGALLKGKELPVLKPLNFERFRASVSENTPVLLTSRLFSSRKDFSQAALAINCLTVA